MNMPPPVTRPLPPPARPSPLHDTATEVVRRLQQAGYTAYFAGGCVRDRLLGVAPKDYDVATNAVPADVERLFRRAKPVGRSFGVVIVPVDDAQFEIATFRRDADYSDGRHPDAVCFSDPATDAQRRDFTINALFLDPIAHVVIDHVNGLADLDARILRAVGVAADRFLEDHLRLLRAVRFSARLEFPIEAATADAIRSCAPMLPRVSAERIRDELTRILIEAAHPGRALLQLESLGLLAVILPEVAAMRGQEQPPEFHPEGDVLTHTVMMLDALPRRDPLLVFAVLLHDIGKPPTATLDGERIRFNCHAGHGERMARGILRRLKFSNDDADVIAHCVGNHMRFMDVQKMRPATLRRLIGAPTFPLELELHRLDCMASHGDMANHDFLVEQAARFAAEKPLPRPWLTGHDILALGIPAGPPVGRYLQMAYDAQLDGALPDRDALLAWIRGRVKEDAATRQ